MPSPAKEPSVFDVNVCPQCGFGVGGDEDGCCTLCGAMLILNRVLLEIRARVILARVRSIPRPKRAKKGKK